ncbi:S-layer homology domain-containing protein [Bacillus sp. 37MA]|uniref:S-layer homology domain-containing protein n=1 Tax=Bacillus sp. 37MA TaxID=1132442 RepID=UPI000376DF69|nr:S-layer homology domain-containing protein [Bacillus sp. 37MA]
MEYKKDAAPSPRFEEAKQWVKENGISDGTYPQRPVTREEVWSMLHRMRSKIANSPGFDRGCYL